MKTVRILILGILVIVVIMSFAHTASAGSGTKPKPPKNGGFTFHVGEKSYTINNALIWRHFESYSLPFTGCVEDFYAITTTSGEHLTLSVTTCENFANFAVFDERGEIWDF